MKFFDFLKIKDQEDASNTANQIIAQAYKERDKILENAKRDAANILENAREECSAFDRSIKWKLLEQQHHDVCDGILEIRHALHQANEMLNTAESAINREYTMRLFSNLYELFELIADVRDNYQGSNENNQSEQLVYNLTEFLDFICDILSGYGINVIVTNNGEPFNGTIHTTLVKEL